MGMGSKSTAALAAALPLGACTNDTQFVATEPNVRLSVEEHRYEKLPAEAEMYARTFGESEFKAERPGAEPFYGILPKQFSTGHLVVDILVFAPGLFFNLREVWPQYQFDVAQGVIRYREGDKDPWIDYGPSADEVERSRAYFLRHAPPPAAAPPP